MRITAMTVAALVVASSVQSMSGSDRQVSVYLSHRTVVPTVLRVQAMALASEMFAGIGVTVNWHSRLPLPSETGAIIIEFVDSTPAALLPNALAYALPYEGIHIRIFWDRIQFDNSSRELLAHVMVHEITHILQGADCHSAAGIMNARWTKQERGALGHRPLHFAAEDVEMIHRAMDSRGAHASHAVAQPLLTMAWVQ
jgi:hypothetical protein